MFAASVVNSIGLDLDKTNVSKSNAWKVSQKKRLKITESVKDEFLCPDNTILHYDGKILCMKGNKESNRVAVYISGVDDSGFKKLLGAPETKDGTGFLQKQRWSGR